MKAPFLITFACLISLFSHAQIKFEPGYTINNSGQKITCYIKDVDWKNNPDKFEYRITPESENITGLLKNFREFGTHGGSKYVGREVQINRSSNKTAELEDSRAIEFQQQKLFLKVLVEGHANLYYYEDGDLRRFFYRIDSGEIMQLRYKRFLKDPDEFNNYKKSETQIGENNEFRQQLWNDFKCDGQSKKAIEKLAYKIDPIMRLFDDYNLCRDSNYVKKEKTRTHFRVNTAIRPGLNLTTLKVDNSFSAFRSVNFKQKSGLRIGLEIEAILPFNKNKWALLAEPTYHSYANEGATTNQLSFSSINYTAEIKYTSLELPIGVRHYMFFTDKLKLFINASLLLDIPFDSNIRYTNGVSETTAQLGFNSSLVAGLGLNFNDKLSIEARYLGSREVFSSSEFISYISDYKGFSLILGYTIF